ncbi:hypothetical protein CTI12_AA411850 [Artemisia annua]|uniref:Uncharacterized protein n=1 Tax=Artemisia annua TaxID=35608 RepID=A0A2U1M6Y8_ARTAN|nr:hypothetical protein CTI12_AA411850 [Artemisia annua]
MQKGFSASYDKWTCHGESFDDKLSSEDGEGDGGYDNMNDEGYDNMSDEGYDNMNDSDDDFDEMFDNIGIYPFLNKVDSPPELHYCLCKLMQRSHLMRSFNGSNFQTIESSLHDTSGPVRSLLASLLFLISIKLLQSLVDLAGSERAAQTNVDGARLIRKLRVAKWAGQVGWVNGFGYIIESDTMTTITCMLFVSLASVLSMATLGRFPYSLENRYMLVSYGYLPLTIGVSLLQGSELVTQSIYASTQILVVSHNVKCFNIVFFIHTITLVRLLCTKPVNNMETPNSELNNAQLLEELSHSQRRAREVERAAQQACNEKKDVISLFLKQASHMFAYKQWLYILQLETLCLQLRRSNYQFISTRFPDFVTWSYTKGKLPKRVHKATKRCKMHMSVGSLLWGLDLVGVGVLLGWTLRNAGWVTGQKRDLWVKFG